MTNYESRMYVVEDEDQDTSAAFWEAPGVIKNADEVVPAMSLKHTTTLPDGQPINVSVNFTISDVRGLQSYLNDVFGRGSGVKVGESIDFYPDTEPARQIKAGDTVHVQLGDETFTRTVAAVTPAPFEHTSEPGPTQQVIPCPHISNGVQCTYAAGHLNASIPHSFEDYQIQNPPSAPASPPPVPTSDGAATPQATEQAVASATGVNTPEAVPSETPAPKKRKRRTKLEIAYDEAMKQHGPQSIQLQEALNALRAKDPGNERLSQFAAATAPEIQNPVAGRDYMSDSSPTPGPQFAPEPTQLADGTPLVGQSFLQPYADQATQEYQQAGNVLVNAAQAAGYDVPQLGQASPQTAEELQAAQAFPCPERHSVTGQPCVRPYGHEIQTATNPDPKPHQFAADVPMLSEQTPGAAQFPQQPQPQFQQPAFSSTPVQGQTPQLGLNEQGAQVLRFPNAEPQPPAPTAPWGGPGSGN